MAMLRRVNRVAMHHQALDHHQLSTGLSLMGRPMSRAKCLINVQSPIQVNVQSPIQVPAYDGPPPQQQVYEHPYYPRQQQQPYFAPVYAMNYNAAHPSVSYGAACYATQPVYFILRRTRMHIGVWGKLRLSRHRIIWKTIHHRRPIHHNPTIHHIPTIPPILIPSPFSVMKIQMGAILCEVLGVQ